MAQGKRAEDDGQAAKKKGKMRGKSPAIRFLLWHLVGSADTHTIRYPAAAELPPQSLMLDTRPFVFPFSTKWILPKEKGVYNMYNEHDDMPSTMRINRHLPPPTRGRA